MTQSRASFIKQPGQLIFYNPSSASVGWLSHIGWLPSVTGPRDRVTDNFSISYVVDGSGAYADANGHTETLTEGACVFTFPGLRHSFGPGGDRRWGQVFASFRGAVFEAWQERGLLDHKRPVQHLEPVDYWATRIYAFKDEFEKRSPARRERTLCRFLEMLTDILAAAPEDSEHAWLEQACRLLEVDTREQRPIAEIAQELGLSYDAFRKAFQQGVGTPPARYRALHRIEAARGLLLEAGLSSREVAEMLGFADEYHFSKRFKQLTGVAPSQLRGARHRGARQGTAIDASKERESY